MPVTLLRLASSVTCSVHVRYVPSFTQVPNEPRSRPTPTPMSISWSSVSPALPSGGCWAKSALAYSWYLPPAAAQPEAADERVEYSVVEKRLRYATGW